MPRAERQEPLHLQISGHYKRLITDGQIRSGDKLPSVRDIATEWDVGQQTAQRAIEHLRTEGLVRTGPGGTFANGSRHRRGPQQRIRAARFPGAERAEILSAEEVAAPVYVVPILGLLEVKPGLWPVIRREWVTFEGETPVMLSVTWFRPESEMSVPELGDPAAQLDAGHGARLIAERTGRAVTWGQVAREARPVKDDGRERPLLRLGPDAHVLAEVYQWASGDEVLEYGEYVVLEGRTVESDMEP